MLLSRNLYITLIFLPFMCSATTISFINPSPKNSPFWDLVTELAQEAAKDLNINIQVHHSKHQFGQTKLIQEISQSENKPDYLVFMPLDGSILQSFKRLNDAQIPFVTIGRVYSNAELSKIDKPQVKYPFWLGEMYHENVTHGATLAKALAKQAIKDLGENTKINAIGLKGDNFSESVQKVQGFIETVNTERNISISQIVTANFRRERAEQKVAELFARHGTSKVIWASSDGMALGAADAIIAMGLDPKDFYIGGFDWMPEAIDAIKSDKLKASIGGHFLQGAWTVVRIYDHSQGMNVFVKGDDSPYIDLELISKDNIHEYDGFGIDFDFSKIDFSLFSLHNTRKNNYQFSMSELLQQQN